MEMTNDCGVWVEDACGKIIGHALFIKALCPDKFPAHATVKFWPAHKGRRKYFLSQDSIPFYYGDCRGVRQHALHLFGMGEAAAMTFMQECDLSDLQFPVRMAGVVLVVAKETVEEFQCRPRLELEWARRQNVPFVIAATGYDSPDFSTEKFRNYFELESNISVVAGPTISWEPTPDLSRYARRVLDTLCAEIEGGLSQS